MTGLRCPKCGCTAFAFTPIFSTEGPAVRAKLEAWAQAIQQEHVAAEAQGLNRWFQEEMARIEEDASQRKAEIEALFAKRKKHGEDPDDLVDTPEEARRQAVQLAGRDKAAREQKAIEQGKQKKRQIKEKVAAALAPTIDYERNRVQQEYSGHSFRPVLLVHCAECGHIVGATNPQETQSRFALDSLHNYLSDILETVNALSRKVVAIEERLGKVAKARPQQTDQTAADHMAATQTETPKLK
jgi:hypothetical protein